MEIRLQSERIAPDGRGRKRRRRRIRGRRMRRRGSAARLIHSSENKLGVFMLYFWCICSSAGLVLSCSRLSNQRWSPGQNPQSKHLDRNGLAADWGVRFSKQLQFYTRVFSSGLHTRSSASTFLPITSKRYPTTSAYKRSQI